MLVLIVVSVFQGDECLAARHQCSNRGAMPFPHWRVSPPPQREAERLACVAIHGRSPLARWRVLWQERECKRIAAHPQRSNGGVILPCMLEVSLTRVEGGDYRAACCQCSNTEAFDCSLGFWILFLILKNYCNAGHFAGRVAQRKSVLRASRRSGAAAAAAPMSPGMTWRRRTHGCSAGCFARRQDAAMQRRLQRQCPRA